MKQVPIAALVAAGILMIGSPAWGVALGTQPWGMDAPAFDLNLEEALERVGGAIKSLGDDVADALVRIELDSPVSLARQAAPKALDPKPFGSEFREYGFSVRRAGIRWRFSLVESAGERS